MGNPFPGVNPYLEMFWRSIHSRLNVQICDALNAQLSEDLVAIIDERVYVELPDLESRPVYPDIRVLQRRRPPKDAPEPTAPIAVAERGRPEPLFIEIDSEPITERFVNIIEVHGERVITTIEILSVANKIRGTGQAQYLKKQVETIEAGINLVEIDLLRTGEWILSLPDGYIPAKYRTPYRVCVFRAERPGAREFYPIPLEEPLPAISVPLRAGEPDVVLDLQPLIDRAYEQGRYHRLIDYTQDPPPPLTDAQRQWIDQLLREKGLRQ